MGGVVLKREMATSRIDGNTTVLDRTIIELQGMRSLCGAHGMRRRGSLSAGRGRRRNVEIRYKRQP